MIHLLLKLSGILEIDMAFAKFHLKSDAGELSRSHEMENSKRVTYTLAPKRDLCIHDYM